MRTSSPVLSLIGSVALSLAAPAIAADNWVGTWKLDPAKSKTETGALPKSRTLKFEATEGGIKLSSWSVDEKGAEVVGSYEAKFDGTESLWKGNPDADTATPQRVDDNTYTNTWKKDGKVTITAKIVVSEDGKTLTVTQTGQTAKGTPVNAVHVYTRQ